MSFQEFCDVAESVDQQKIKASETFTIRFENSKGEYFYVDPNDLVGFITFVKDNYDDCVEVITSQPSFKNKKPYEYEEKGYRALYKLAEDNGLKVIGSLGKSQTKSLARVIGKLISYVSGRKYLDVTRHSGIDKNVIIETLSLMPDDLSNFIRQSSVEIQPNLMKEMFVAWLLGKGKSAKSAQSYAGTSINLANKLLRNLNSEFDAIYSISSLEKLTRCSQLLEESDEWKQKNTDGNSMFRAGLNHYHRFLEDYLNEDKSQTTYSGSQLGLPKPFILLAGISGTGKTRFVREQAGIHNLGNKNFCLVPVRPDWHEPSDLLGYVSRIGKKPVYVSTKVLEFIIEAWKAVAPNANSEGMGELSLDSAPYWLCLDEMNLAPVEQFFADYLSVLESRKLIDGKYSCDPLLDKSILTTEDADIQKALKLTDKQDLWDFFCKDGISLPPNLILAGTVNMDETTHGFSRKVIDRAFSIDFGEFFPNDYSRFFKGQALPKALTYNIKTQVTLDTFECIVDADGGKTIAFLDEVNDVLRNTPFELAYRALNEILLHVDTFKPDSEEKLQAVWDDFLMTKVLPRIDGDDDKLRIVVNGETLNLLEHLNAVLSKTLNLIWDEDKRRIDLLRNDADGSEIQDVLCRSRKKIGWMLNRLDVNTFTSYWP